MDDLEISDQDMEITPEEQAEIDKLSSDELPESANEEVLDRLAQVADAITKLQESISVLVQSATRPKKTTLIRDASGRPTHSVTETV